MDAPCVGWEREDGILFYVDEKRLTAQALDRGNDRILFDIPEKDLPEIPFDPTPYFERVDQERPLPAPPPRVGDAWMSGSLVSLVIEVLHAAQWWEVKWAGTDIIVRYAPENQVETLRKMGVSATAWPPPGTLLVGRLSPAAWTPSK